MGSMGNLLHLGENQREWSWDESVRVSVSTGSELLSVASGEPQGRVCMEGPGYQLTQTEGNKTGYFVIGSTEYINRNFKPT